MINWPEALEVELAARRCIIFIGAGASANAERLLGDDKKENPETWKGLLKRLLVKSREDGSGSIAKATELLEAGQLLECAEIIRSSCIPSAEYNRVLDALLTRYSPTEIHKAVERLDQKVVVTTNFDTLYEDHCKQGEARDAYSVIKYNDTGLISRMRSPKRLIIKAHGCVSQPENTVLTKSDFFRARSEYPGFFRTLESLFLTHTLLFVGYSLSDPDIQLLLENNTITYPSDNPHYAVMAKGTHPAIKAVFYKTNNVDVIEFDPKNSYQELTDSLWALCETVDAIRETNVS
ncbi:SIR2 family protein [Yersinia proxima]|uniref:SIR2 family protein n=1 Tax=Yersinia proxima TaxID=2890316 RepID=UPI001D125E81|nr:SIR2 family protein [Yersinia proxima]